MKKNKNDYKVLVLEDEPLTQTNIVNMVQNLGYTVSGTAQSYKEAMEAADNIFPDVALCDINILGYKDGITVAKELSQIAFKRNINLAIIYITVYDDDETVDEAIKTRPVAYLLKSQATDEKKLGIQIRLAIEAVENNHPSSTTVFDDSVYGIWSRGKCYHVEINTILYLKAKNNYCVLYTEEEVISINQSFGEIIAQLEPFGIQQVHRSYAVNMSKVKAHDRGPTFIYPNYKKLSPELKSEVEQVIGVSAFYRPILRDKFGLN